MSQSIDDYLALIPSANRGRAKFVATVRLLLEPLCQAQGLLEDLPLYFDLDTAVGVQLDQVGAWIGRSRYIPLPLDIPWFSFDVAGRGFDQGIWKGPLSPTTGISPLDDETYRSLLRAIVAANAWDGTRETGAAILNQFYETQGASVVFEDRQDMSLNIIGTGSRSVIVLSVMDGQIINIKPAGVQTTYILSSVPSAPVFGFDMDNDVIAGFDTGSWGVTPSYIINNSL